MKNFNFYAPTQVVFGRNTETQVAELVKKYGGSKILLHYGGQSAIRSGLLAKVEQTLQEAGISYVKLGGVKPNPRLSLVRKGIQLCKDENVDFILLWVAVLSSIPVRPSLRAASMKETCGPSMSIRTMQPNICLSAVFSPSLQPVAR